MTQGNNVPSCLQSVKTHHPKVHMLLQRVAEEIFAKVEVAVSLDQQLETQVEQAITLGILQQRGDKIAFVEPKLQEDYLAQYAVNVLLPIWDDMSIFLEKIEQLYHCGILLGYDLALGARSLCTLTHEHSKDLINRVIEVANLRSNEDTTHEHFWHLYELFCAALPDLRPEPKPLANALEVIESVNPGAVKILYEIQGLLKQSQATAEAFYQEFISRSNPIFAEFVFTSLLILSQFDFQTAHRRATLLTGSSNPVEVKLGIAVLGRLNYNNAEQSELLAITLACFNTFLIQQDSEIASILTRAYGDLLDQSNEAIAKIVELSAHSDLVIRQQVAQVLCCRAEQFFQQDWYKVALFALLRKPLLHPEILGWLDSVIRRYVGTEPSCATQAIESLALNWDYIDHDDKALPDVVQSTLMELFNHRRDALAAALTQWFASKIPRLHRAATDIEHFFCISAIEQFK